MSAQAHPGHGTRESTQKDHGCRHNYMQTKGLHNQWLGYDPMSLFWPFGDINSCANYAVAPEACITNRNITRSWYRRIIQNISIEL